MPVAGHGCGGRRPPQATSWGPPCPSPCPGVLGCRQKARRGFVSCLPWHLPVAGGQHSPSSVPPERSSHLEGVTGLKIEGVSMAPGNRLETSGPTGSRTAGSPFVEQLLGNGLPFGSGSVSCLPSAGPAQAKHKDRSWGNMCHFMKTRWPQPVPRASRLSVGVKSSLRLSFRVSAGRTGCRLAADFEAGDSRARG